MKRIEFMKHTLDLYVHALEPGISRTSVESAEAAYEAIDSADDVKQYGEKYGDGMPLVLPTVVESDGSMPSSSHTMMHSTPTIEYVGLVSPLSLSPPCRSLYHRSLVLFSLPLFGSDRNH
jgi:hypothetical protein